MNSAREEAAMSNVQLPESIRELERTVPPAIVTFLQRHENVALVFERDPQSGNIRVGVRKVYRRETKRTLESAKQALAAKEKAGYSKEDAFKEFWEAQDEIAAQLEKNDC